MADDDTNTHEELSRLKQIREQKRLEQFLSTIDTGLKPVIDTEKNPQRDGRLHHGADGRFSTSSA